METSTTTEQTKGALSHLVLFDLDGTALPSVPGSSFSKRLKNAIQTSPEDIGIAIATGRSWDHFWPVVSDIANHLEACIISGGSQIVDCQTREILWQVGLSLEQIEALNEVAGEYNKQLSFNSDVRTIDRADKIKNAFPTVVYLLDIHPTELQAVYGAVSKIPHLYAAITNAWGEGEDKVLHITHKRANKGIATMKLLGILGLDQTLTTAIGDGLNDVPMFEVVGNALAVAGSIVEGHESVNAAIGSVADDGLATYLEGLRG